MRAKAIIYTTSGAIAEADTTRQALADFWRRQSHVVRAAVIDINLTLWIYDAVTGWERGSKFRYVPGRPDLWRVEHPRMVPTLSTPFDRR